MRKVIETCDLCNVSFDYEFALKKIGLYIDNDLFINRSATPEHDVCPNCYKKIKLELQETYNAVTRKLSIPLSRTDGFAD